MHAFKLKPFFVCLVFSMVSTGCIKDEIIREAAVCDVLGESTGLFDVLEVEGKVHITDSGTGGGVLDSDLVLDFKACITDRQKIGGTKLTESDFTIYTFNPYKKEDEQKALVQSRIEPHSIPGDEENRPFQVITARTDSEGCLRWSETYQYTEPREQKWIYFERVIKNLSGAVVIPLTVNPWHSPRPGHDERKIYDLRVNEWVKNKYQLFKLHEISSKESLVEQCIQKRSLKSIFHYLGEKGEKLNKPVLWMEDIHITSLFENVPRPKSKDAGYYKKYKICHDEQTEAKDRCDPVGSFLRVGMKLSLEILSKDHQNIVKANPVQRGLFKVTSYLVAEKDGEHYMLHRPLPPQIAEISGVDESLRVPEFTLHIPYDIAASVKLLLKVEAEDQSVEPFYGMFKMAGEVNNLHNEGRSLTLEAAAFKNGSENGSMKEEIDRLQQRIDRIKNFKEKFEPLTEDKRFWNRRRTRIDQGFSRSKLALDLKRMRFARVDASGMCESVVNRTVVYIGEVCLKDPRRKIEFSNQSIEVIAEDVKLKGEKDLNIGASAILKTISPRHAFVEKNGKGEKYFCHGQEIHKQDFLKLPDSDDPHLPGFKLCPKNKLVRGKTEDLGCIQFLYHLNHKPYDRQRYFLKKLIFKSTEYGYEDEKFVALNPWEFGFLTYQDVTQLANRTQESLLARIFSGTRHSSRGRVTISDSDEDIQFFNDQKDLESLLSSQQLAPPILRLNEFRSIDIEPSYQIDSSLNIKTIKNIMFLLQPKIYRSDSIAKTIREEPFVLPKGYFLVRFILAKGPQEMHDGKSRIMEGALEADLKRVSLNPLGGLLEFYQEHKRTAGLFASGFGGVEAQFNSEEFFNQSDIQECMAPNCYTFKEEDYISHYDTVAYSENGVVSAFVKQGFDTGHFRYMGSKNSIIFEMHPTDPQGYYRKAGSCDIDVKKSKFTPYKDHDLKTPPHWGLFHSSEFGNFNIVRPISKVNIEAFDKKLGPLGEIKISHNLPLTDEMIQKNIKAVHQFAGMRERAQELGQNRIDEVLNKIQSENFCVETPDFTQTLLPIGNFKDNPENPWFKMCVCASFKRKKYYDADIIRSCLVKKDFISDFISIQENHPAKLDTKFTQVIEKELMDSHGGDKARFCQTLDPIKSSVNFTSDSDFSPKAQAYTDCICQDSPPELSLTESIAECFAQNEGLRVINVEADETFSQDLNQLIPKYEKLSQQLECGQHSSERSFLYMSPEQVESGDSNHFIRKLRCMPKMKELHSEDLGGIISEAFSPENIQNKTQGSFLHLMCNFWFDKYYKKYLTEETALNFYEMELKSFERTKALAQADPELAEDDAALKGISSINFTVPEKFKVIPEPFKPYGSYGGGRPYRKCIKNPLSFFHIEKKVIAGRIEEADYQNGNVAIFNIGDSAYKESRKDWAVRQSSSIEASVSASIGTDLKGKMLRFVGADARGSGKAATSQDESQGVANRTANTTSNMITTAVNEIVVDLTLSRYKECLVITPKRGVFEHDDDAWSEGLTQNEIEYKEILEFRRWPYRRTGLLLCSNERNIQDAANYKSLREHYYYLHQFFGGHAYEFMSRTIYHNRPYTALLRGKQELDRLLFFVDALYKFDRSGQRAYEAGNRPDNLFLYTRNIKAPVQKAFINTPMDATGFYPGLYSAEGLKFNFRKDKPTLFDKGTDGTNKFLKKFSSRSDIQNRITNSSSNNSFGDLIDSLESFWNMAVNADDSTQSSEN